ncbi:hypothetical protein LSAT2_019787 [Lamellibrachia satsuma]|nr:hypothetical protein LSAT2_019787 [Lamellibrachia satsuma]
MPTGQTCRNEEDAIFKSTLRRLHHSTSLLSALPEQLSASSEKVANRGGGACIMSAPVTDKQHRFHSNIWRRRRGRASLVTLNREDCTHEETEKPEKGETTGNGFTGTRPYSIDNGGTLQS